jgi:two-component system phosphate regulon sensor histidine kinase PhoR
VAGWIFSAVVMAAAFVYLRYRLAKTDHQIEEFRSRASLAQSSSNLERQDAQMLATAIDHLRHGVLILSTDSKIQVMNPAAIYLLNLSNLGDWKNRSLVEVVRFPGLNQAFAAVCGGEGVQKVSIEVPLDEGVRSVKVRVTKLSTPEFDRVLVSLQDETDAMLLDQTRREFVANTSHEFKTPLAAIKGYAETVELAINDDPDAAQHFMRQINVECLRLERLIADMMQLARAQSSDQSLTLSNVRLTDVIQQSLSSNSPVAESKSIELICELGVGEFDRGEIDAAMVRADPEAALTIVNNLISNAIRYTQTGGKVRVGIRDAGKFYAIYVHDTGVGIAVADQKRIFERFYRVHQQRQHAVNADDQRLEIDRGTGIGLSIVKQLTRALGGEVQVSSQPGVGSRFEVLFPKVLVQA